MNPAVRQVHCQGRFWQECYKDGVEGVYKKNRSSSTSAVKNTLLNDPDIQLGDGVVDALYKRAMQAIRGSCNKMTIKNDSASSSSSCIRPVSLPAPGEGASSGGSGASSVGLAPQAATSPSGLHSEESDKRQAMWSGFLPTHLPTPAKAQAKTAAAKAKPKAQARKRAAAGTTDKELEDRGRVRLLVFHSLTH